jgi:hypothetical protein
MAMERISDGRCVEIEPLSSVAKVANAHHVILLEHGRVVCPVSCIATR